MALTPEDIARLIDEDPAPAGSAGSYFIRSVCSYCKKELGTKPTPRADQHGKISHGMCRECEIAEYAKMGMEPPPRIEEALLHPGSQPIEIITWISHPREMDLGDVMHFATVATKPGTKCIFIDGEHVKQAEAVLFPAAPDKIGELGDKDEFGQGDEADQAVVLYRGEGSEEDIALAYVKSVNSDFGERNLDETL